MMQTNYYFYFLFISIFFVSTTASAQTGNFDETWKEFLENNKISNMSTLIKPDKLREQPDYAKYLLMNTNTNFCQSDVADAEKLMEEIQEMNIAVHKSIPGFITKKEDLQSKIKAFHTMDDIWKEFLRTKEVSLEELEAVTAAKTSCEKQTLAKYSYMTAYYHFCSGDVSKAKNLFETRTLRLAEKTTLRVEDVKGLAPEVAKMKLLFQDISKLDVAWRSYIQTDVSPGFDTELPLFPCYPIPNMKEFVLKGVADVCSAGPEMLEKIRNLETESGVVPDRELKGKIKALEDAIAEKEAGLATLNEAWEAFIPDNKVRHMGKYGYDYCDKEPLIRAYIMDGFVFVCDLAEENLLKIDELQSSDPVKLDKVTQNKMNELAELFQLYQANGRKIEKIWDKFVARGDVLTDDYESTSLYCDHVQEVKDWTMKGLSGDCQDGHEYLTKIDELNERFDFKFYEELECRIQKLRIKLWDCRYEVLKELAQIDAPDDYETKLEELLVENRMGDRPEVCASNR